MTSSSDPYKLFTNLRLSITHLIGCVFAVVLLFCPAITRAQNCIQFLYCTNISVPCEGPWGAHVTYAAVATNSCSATAQPTVTYNPPPGGTFPPGDTMVCATAMVPGLPAISCCFTVSVDRCCGTNCIRLVCPPDFVFPCDAATGNGTFVDLNQPQFKPYLTNLCGGPIPSSLVVGCSPAAPAGGGPIFFPAGETTVICCVTNLQNTQNTAIDCCCFKIFVLTNCTQISPTNCRVRAICPTNVLVCVTNGLCTTNVPFLVPTLVSSCANATLLPQAPTWTTRSGSCFPLGKTTVGVCVPWLLLNGGAVIASGTNCCCYDVVVTCCTNPCDSTLKCPGDIVLDCPGPNGIALHYSAFATNPCYPQATFDCIPTNGTIIFGNTNVCCKLEYAGPLGEIVLTQCCFKVTVLCPTNCTPVITCPSNIFITCAGPRGAYVTYPPITVTDSCPALTVKYFCNPPSGSFFPIGCRVVTCAAVDSAGHVATCKFVVCVQKQGCYVLNPSFERLIVNAPPNNCGEPVDDALGWVTIPPGAPKLFRPPAAVPSNCWGDSYPCDGTNYAGFSGGFSTAGGFQTDTMMGRTIVPLMNGKKYQVSACLSIPSASPVGSVVLVEFLLANYANPAQQTVINYTWVQTRSPKWQGVQPVPTPCFVVPQDTNIWDAIIIRASKATTINYPYGNVYIDKVNICCCPEVQIVTGPNPTLSYVGSAMIGFSHDLAGIVDPMMLGDGASMDPDTGMSMLTLSRSFFDVFTEGFFKLMAPQPDTIDCGCYP